MTLPIPRSFLPLPLVLCAAACSDGGAEIATESAAQPAVARNVVIYLVDTLRADHLSCYGYERPTSPAIDAFAEEAVLFERCLSQSTWTKPSTASVLTGLYPSQHGATRERLPVRDDIETLAERLFAHGLRTFSVYTNAWLAESHGLQQGFEASDFVRKENPHTRDTEAVDRALSYVETLGERPFFLYLHQVAPHAPYDPPPRFAEAFDRGYEGSITGYVGLKGQGGKLNELSEADVQHLIDLYDAEIAYSDHEFGRFIEGLRALGRLDDTLIVFLADHGEEFGEHRGWRHNPNLFDQVVHVPLIVRFPGAPREVAGERYGGLAMQVDVMPTVLAAVGLDVPDDLPGRDLRALLAGGAEAREPKYGIVEVDSGGQHRIGVVGEERKYVRAYAPESEEFLYDLAADPGETVNVLETSPSSATRHRDTLDAYVRETTQGLFVLVQNGRWPPFDAEVVVTTRRAPHVVPFYTEELEGQGDMRDGEPSVRHVVGADGEPRVETRILFHVEGRNGDGARFVLPDEALDEPFEVTVTIDGAPVAIERFLVGDADVPAGDAPFSSTPRELGSAAAAPFPSREDLGKSEHRVRIWSGSRPTVAVEIPANVELSEEEIEAFQALGYMGGDE